MSDSASRCPWCLATPEYVRYHDEEWGRPVRDDRVLFEFLILEGAQAGLSWRSILQRRDGYRRAFADFDPAVLAQYRDEQLEALMSDAGIIRNRQKIWSVRGNAQAFLAMQREFGSFSDWLWREAGGAVIDAVPATMAEVPAKTALSDRISKALAKRGFKFVGSTIIYAYLQAVGVVNDHLRDCPARSAATPTS